MQAGAVATKGVLGDACAAGHRERSGMTDGGARVPEVLSAAELEGFFACRRAGCFLIGRGVFRLELNLSA